jgi:hypothetical protein
MFPRSRIQPPYPLPSWKKNSCFHNITNGEELSTVLRIFALHKNLFFHFPLRMKSPSRSIKRERKSKGGNQWPRDYVRVEAWRERERERERKSKMRESVSTKRERKSKRRDQWPRDYVLRNNPCSLFFSSPNIISTSSRGSEGGELGRRSKSLRSSPLAPWIFDLCPASLCTQRGSQRELKNWECLGFFQEPTSVAEWRKKKP